MLVQSMPYPAAAPSGPASTQWRISFVNGASGSRMWLEEVELREAPGGVDQCTGGTASASSSYFIGSPAMLVDDDVISGGSLWSPDPGNGTGAWWQYTFAAPKSIAEVWMQGTSSAGERPRQMDFQYHDGSGWVTLWSGPALPTWDGSDRATFTKP